MPENMKSTVPITMLQDIRAGEKATIQLFDDSIVTGEVDTIILHEDGAANLQFKTFKTWEFA